MLIDLIGKIGYNALIKKDPSYTSINGIRPDSTIDLEDLKELAEVAKDNPHLSSILMCSNDIDDEGAAYLAQLQSVTELVLEGNQISTEGIAALVKMPRLKKLNLGSNSVDDEGAKLLARSQLTHLHLYGNQITDEGGKLFLENKTLVELILPRKTISPSVKKDVEQHIENNKKSVEEKPSQKLVSPSPASSALPAASAREPLKPISDKKKEELPSLSLPSSFSNS